MNRPLVWVAVPFAMGALVAQWPPVSADFPAIVALTLFSAAAAGWAAWRYRDTRRPLTVALLFLAAGGIWTAARTSGPPGDALSARALAQGPRAVTLEGTVRRAGLWHDERRTLQAEVVADQIIEDGTPRRIHGVTSVRWRDPAYALYPGERVRVTGVLSPSIGEVNPGVMSFEDYARRRGIHSRIEATGPYRLTVVGAPFPLNPFYHLARLRESQAELLRQIVAESALPFAATIWLGDRSGLDDALFDRYAAAGTAHILAVSGLHMGIVAASVILLLRRLVRRPRWRALLAIAIIFAFAIMAGGRISALRAATMFACYLLAEVLDREPDVPSALSLAGLVFLLWDPTLLREPGFQLSFLAVGSILMFARPIDRLLAESPARLRRVLDPSLSWYWADRVLPPKHPDKVEDPRPSTPRGLLATALAVQILPTPIASGLFHVVPLAGPLVNLAVVPLLTLALWLCVLAATTGVLWPEAGALFGHALAPIVWTIDTLSTMAAMAPLGHLRVTVPSALSVAAFLGAAIIAAGAVPIAGRRRALMTAALLMASLVLWRPAAPKPVVAFLDVGDGDATFIRTPGGSTVLIDGGLLADHQDMGRRVVAPYLWGQGVSRVDYVVGTHAHADHFGGLFYVLEHFEVGALVLGPISSGTDLEDGLLAVVAQRGIPVQRVAAGDALPVLGASLAVVYPPADIRPSTPLNDQSLVFAYEWDGVRILLTGDIEHAAEADLARRGSVRAEVFKVPHHGRNTSSTPAILDAVRPRSVVISSAYTELHPGVHPEVATRLASRGLPTWRTDQHGAITLRVVEGREAWSAARAEKGYPHAPLPVLAGY